MGGDLDRSELDPPLLSLAIPPTRKGDAEAVSRAIERLPRKAVEKARLLLEPVIAVEQPRKRRRVEQQQQQQQMEVVVGPMGGGGGGMVF